jgi:BMFP domain-containing protein YqiC
MSNSEKILKTISTLIENGILTSKDIKKEISTDLKFKKDKIINKLELVSRVEFEVLKKLVQKQDTLIKKLLKNKKLKR